MDIYDKIYDVSRKHMVENDMDFSFSKEAFKSILYVNPYIVDVNEFLSLSDKDFIYSVYLRVLNRLPDQMALSSYFEQINNPNADSDIIKYNMLLAMIHSPEFKDKGKKVNNLGVLEKKIKDKGKHINTKIRLMKARATVSGCILKYIVLPIWNVIPENMRKKLRKIILHQ